MQSPLQVTALRNVSPVTAHLGVMNRPRLRRRKRRWIVTEETVILFSQLLLLKWFLVWIWPYLTWLLQVVWHTLTWLIHLPP